MKTGRFFWKNESIFHIHKELANFVFHRSIFDAKYFSIGNIEAASHY